jgi:hypothetical protein
MITYLLGIATFLLQNNTGWGESASKRINESVNGCHVGRPGSAAGVGLLQGGMSGHGSRWAASRLIIQQFGFGL